MHQEDRPLDAIGFMQRAVFCAFLVVAAGAGGALILSLDRQAPVTQAEFVAAHTELAHPLLCDVRIADGMTSATMSRERCYATKATRGAK